MATVPPAPTAFAPYQATTTELWVNVNSNGNGGSTVIDWQIRYSKNSDGDVESGAKYLYFDNVAHVSFLDIYTEYYFWARGRNSVGWGPYSNRVHGHTLPRVPFTPSPPMITEIDPDTTRIRLDWDAGPDYAPILEQQIGSGRDPNSIETLSPSDGDTLFTRQAWYVLYYYWARIRNEGGWSPWSPRVSSRTKSYPPEAPTAISVGNQTQTSFQYHFGANDNGGDSNVSWQVGYSTNSAGPTSFIHPASLYQTISNLSRYTTYWVWSRGSNSGGWGGWSAPMSIKTKAYTPAAPTPISCTVQSQTEIRYIFSGNDNGGSAILEWQIGYGKDPNNVQTYLTSSGNSLIGKLDPGKTYYFWSRGRNVEGWGNWSARSQATTYAGARVRYGGTWHTAVPYVRLWSVWNLVQPYVKVNGVWKKTS